MCHVPPEVWAKEYNYHFHGHKFQNAQHVTWSSGARVMSWGVIHAEIVWSDLGMVCVQMMFREVVCKIFDLGANEQ